MEEEKNKSNFNKVKKEYPDDLDSQLVFRDIIKDNMEIESIESDSSPDDVNDE